jgi:aspartyl-tRNA(Asn)/glutamyl-tRNA(Gln) amidotransferase subunit B
MLEYSLPEYDADVLTSDKALAAYFEECAKTATNPKLVSNWVMTEVRALQREKNLQVRDFPVPAARLSQLLNLISEGSISFKVAKGVFREMAESGRDAGDVVSAQGLFQLQDKDEIERVVEMVLAENPKGIAKYRSGKTEVFGFFVGEVMKITNQRADPGLVNTTLREKLEAV